MQCPRCGLQNAPGATQCMRCAHAFAPAGATPVRPRPAAPARPPVAGAGGQPAEQGQWQHPGYTPKPKPPAEPEPPPKTGGAWRILAAIALTLAALAAISYGGWALTARRRIFADLADGSVSRAAAVENDRLDAILLWTAIGLLILGIGLWLLAHLLSGRAFGIVGFTAMALFGTGLVVTVAGAYVTSLVDGPAQADRAATGWLVMGLGFLLLASGAIAALLAVFAARSRSESPAAGFAGWQRS